MFKAAIVLAKISCSSDLLVGLSNRRPGIEPLQRSSEL